MLGKNQLFIIWLLKQKKPLFFKTIIIRSFGSAFGNSFGRSFGVASEGFLWWGDTMFKLTETKYSKQ